MTGNTDALDERGYFWWGDEPTPEGHFAPEIGSFGLLTITSVGDIRLSLDGTLTRSELPSEIFRNSGQQSHRQILGVLKEDDRSVMLVKVWGDGGRVSTNGLSNENFMAELCLISQQRIEWPSYPLLCDELIVSLAGFEEWLRLGSVAVKRDGLSFHAHYEKPQSHDYFVDNDTISVRYDYQAHSRFASKTDELTFKDEVSLNYTMSQPVSLDEAIDQYTSLEDLLILLTNVDRSLKWPLLRFGSSIYATRCHRRRARTESAVKWVDCWTSFPGLAQILETVLQLWKVKRNLIGPLMSD